MQSQATELRILLVEDNPDHAFLTERALREAQPELAERIRVQVVTDGKTALGLLRGAGQEAESARPDLVLLDIQMAGTGGLDVLRTMKSDPELRTIPVIMLTTSDRAADVEASYGLGANEYVVKPVTAAEFRAKVQAIPAYWSRVVTRPPRD